MSKKTPNQKMLSFVKKIITFGIKRQLFLKKILYIHVRLEFRLGIV